MKSRVVQSGIRSLRLASIALALVSLTMPQPVAAQAVSGTILGTVRDGTGAAIPGASVTLTNTDTGLARTVATNAVGEYTAPQLPTGNYTVKGELTGFKTVSLSNIHVGVDQSSASI